MKDHEFHNNRDYATIVDLLIRLHALMRAGLGDSEPADEIRDKMDQPWQRLNTAEQARVDGMSADLCTLELNSPIVHPRSGGILSPALAAAIRSARRAGGFEQILRLLRERPADISADRAAFIRGWCYEHLRDVDISALFFEHAAQLDQTNDLYAVFSDA